MIIQNVTPKNLDRIEEKEIYKFLEIVDSDFYPALSQRPNGISGFINEFILHRGEIYVYKNPMIIGAIGYWYRGKEKDDCYCHLLGVLKEYRKTKIGYTLLNEAFKTVDNTNLRIVSVRTWPENKATIGFVNGLGYKLVKKYYEAEMDRTSLLYEKDVNEFIKSLNKLFPENR